MSSGAPKKVAQVFNLSAPGGRHCIAAEIHEVHRKTCPQCYAAALQAGLPAVLRSSVAGGDRKDRREKVSRAEGWRRDRQPDGWAQPDNAGNRASGPMAR